MGKAELLEELELASHEAASEDKTRTTFAFFQSSSLLREDEKFVQV